MNDRENGIGDDPAPLFLPAPQQLAICRGQQSPKVDELLEVR